MKMSSRLPAVISHKFIKERNIGLHTVLAEKKHTTYILDPEGIADESSSQDYHNAGACPNQ